MILSKYLEYLFKVLTRESQFHANLLAAFSCRNFESSWWGKNINSWRSTRKNKTNFFTSSVLFLKNNSSFDLIRSEDSQLRNFWDYQYGKQLSCHHILDLLKESSWIQGIMKPILSIGFSISHRTSHNQSIFNFHTAYCSQRGPESPCQLSYPKANPQPLAALLTKAAMYIPPGSGPDALFLLHEMINYVVSFCLSDRGWGKGVMVA